MKKSRLLTINLLKKSYTYSNINLEFIGGRGFAIEYYSKLNDKSAIIITTAKYSQNPHEVSGRYSIGYYSPLYKKFRTSSVRGNLGKSLKDLGLDVVYICGNLEVGVAILIKKDEVEFLSNAYANLKTSFIKISDSGKNISPLATAFDETGRQFGQGGLGAVFGSKKLESLFVVSNNKKEILTLPSNINCDDCKKQKSISVIESTANKYFIDSHLFGKLSKHFNITETPQLESLAKEVLQKNIELNDYFESFSISNFEPRKDNEKMILADCLGLCGLAMSKYILNDDEKELINKIVLTEENIK